jgi:hypothetical protein
MSTEFNFSFLILLSYINLSFSPTGNWIPHLINESTSFITCANVTFKRNSSSRNKIGNFQLEKTENDSGRERE